MESYILDDMKGFVSAIKEAGFSVSMQTHGSIRPRQIPIGYPEYADGASYTAAFLHLDGRLVLINHEKFALAGYHYRIRDALVREMLKSYEKNAD